MTVTIKILVPILICIVANAEVHNHECIPTSFHGLCILEYVFYHPNNNGTHIFPKGHPLIRISNKNTWANGVHSVIENFDADLHNQLGQPEAVEIINVYMTSLEIPLSLHHANFEDNSIEWFTIEVDAGREPSISLLDLSGNSIFNLTNISRLINLESLYLASNRIQTIDKRVFAPLIKLKYLSLNQNKLVQLSLSTIPPSLTSLWLYYNEIRVISFDSSKSFPSLKAFNVEKNNLESLNISALIQAMPRLQIVRFGNNKLDRSSVLAMVDILRRHNISYSFANEGDTVVDHCYYGHVEGVCLQEQMMERGWPKAAILSLLTAGTASVFVWIVWRVFVAMNK
ncbi:uncharacterized protein LOC128743211 [Sabethes cyaneus]|uniref:uncharacterized protein LOC128743211 n=1 Tax=Sabethes cyaneus TaxID=53552 RepID=UPI00237E281F|nr:uncharacterized protein LOC128743211 [Sabethes cyaneus]